MTVAIEIGRWIHHRRGRVGHPHEHRHLPATQDVVIATADDE
jgi:hypothetical protein